MAALTVSSSRHSRLLGLGEYRPAREVSTVEIAERLGLEERWIVKRSGIRSRRVAGPDEPLPVMAASAAAAAVAAADIDPAQVGCVIVATTSHLTQMPALACDVAVRIGAGRIGTGSAAAFDILAACAGFPYALALAGDLVRAGTADHVLVVGAERMTDIVAQDDPRTAFLFADGAGAAVVGPADEPGIGPTVWGSDGTRADAVGMTGHWTPDLRTDPDREWPRLGLNGWKVYRWATGELAEVAAAAVKAAGLTPADVDVFVPHQANMLITDELVSRLDLRADVVVGRDIAESGNTSSASIPLALLRLRAEGHTRPGQVALLIGFGSGLAYAAQVVVLP